MGRRPETPEQAARKQERVWEVLLDLGGPGSATQAQVAEALCWGLWTVERYWPLATDAPLFATTVSLPDAAQAERMSEALNRGLRDGWVESAPLFATTFLQEPQGRPMVATCVYLDHLTTGPDGEALEQGWRTEVERQAVVHCQDVEDLGLRATARALEWWRDDPYTGEPHSVLDVDRVRRRLRMRPPG